MLRTLLGTVFFTVTFLLYCLISASTPYDKAVDDMEQEWFLREWNRR